MKIREFTRADGDAVRALWVAGGLRIRPGDDDDALTAFADPSPGLFVLAEEDDRLVGSALAGWDGRRGWLYHVAVRPELRRRGIARGLVALLEDRLRALGCPKVNLIVWDDNEDAMRFWESLGYVLERAVEYGKHLK